MTPTLLIDGSNIFLRAYCASGDIDKHGHPCGGTSGTLRTLQKLIETYIPSKCFVIWEAGGSTRRRQLFSEYKQNRKPLKLNRFYEGDIPDSDQNRTQQQINLINILKHLPIAQLYVENCEADDQIAYLCRSKLRNENKIIASSDKDFYQLLNSTTKIYSPTKKKIYTEQDVLSEFQIHPRNFALAKAICGDDSDNINGIEGAGFKTIAKRFPAFAQEQELSLEDVFKLTEGLSDKLSLKTKILENKELLQRNIKLIDLSTNQMLAPNQIQKIDYSVDNFKPKMDKLEVMKKIIQEGLNSVDPNRLCFAFRSLLDV